MSNATIRNLSFWLLGMSALVAIWALSSMPARSEPARLDDAALERVTAGLTFADIVGNRLGSDPRLSPAGLAARFGTITFPSTSVRLPADDPRLSPAGLAARFRAIVIPTP